MNQRSWHVHPKRPCRDAYSNHRKSVLWYYMMLFNNVGIAKLITFTRNMQTDHSKPGSNLDHSKQKSILGNCSWTRTECLLVWPVTEQTSLWPCSVSPYYTQTKKTKEPDKDSNICYVFDLSFWLFQTVIENVILKKKLLLRYFCGSEKYRK